MSILNLTEPNTPLNDADHVGSFNFIGGFMNNNIQDKQLNKHQKPLTIEEQVQNLKDIGLIIQDEDYAKSILENISYFRLIKAYSLGLKEKNKKYYENVSFENIVQLYMFNSDFRHLLFPMIEDLEIRLRCKTANYFCEKYGVLGYLDKNNFANGRHHQDL